MRVVSRFSSLSGRLNPIEALLDPPVLVPFNRGFFIVPAESELVPVPSVQYRFRLVYSGAVLRREQLNRDPREIRQKNLRCGT